MKKLLSIALSIILAVAFMASCKQVKPSPRKVLFVGVDGLASWCLEKAIDSISDRLHILLCSTMWRPLQPKSLA